MTKLRRQTDAEKLFSQAQRIAAGATELEPATPHTDGVMAAGDKAKLDGIEDGANKSWTPQQIEDGLRALRSCIEDYVAGCAAKDHYHDDRYMPAAQLVEHLGRKVDRDDLSPDNLLERMEQVKSSIDAGKLGGEPARAYMLVRELTADYLVKLLAGTSGIDASSLDGRSLSWFLSKFEPRDPAIVKSNVPRVYQTGARYLSAQTGNIGASSGGRQTNKFQPDPQKANFWWYLNVGEHAFCAPAATLDYEMIVRITHTSQCGLIAFTGFQSLTIDGEAPDSSELYPMPGEQHFVRITKIGNHIDAEVRRLRPVKG